MPTSNGNVRVRTQSLLITLYGDYIRSRGGEIWVGGLIKLLSHFGATAQAVRSSLSRMCQKDYIKARRVGNKSFYSLSAGGKEWMDNAARRIFAAQDSAPPWDGMWRQTTYSIPEDKRDLRERLRQELGWLGFAPLGQSTWINPNEKDKEIDDLVRKLGIAGLVESFTSTHCGYSTDRELAGRLWDLPGINRRYQEFYDQLPPDWLGAKARRLFALYYELLTPEAERFFDSIFEGAPRGVREKRRTG